MQALQEVLTVPSQKPGFISTHVQRSIKAYARLGKLQKEPCFYNAPHLTAHLQSNAGPAHVIPTP